MNNNLTKQLYLFSGLGADERVFQKLDFSGYSITFIKWITPLREETIEQYAARLLDQIKTTKPILIGLSFGGLIAIEVAKQIDTEKVVLIASAKTQKEIPFYFRMAGHLGLLKILPSQLLKKSNIISNWFFGTNSSFDNLLLKQILKDTDITFLKWAIDKVVHWTNRITPKNLVHIHETSDRILPNKFVNDAIRVKGGGHFMTLNKADVLNKMLQQVLA